MHIYHLDEMATKGSDLSEYQSTTCSLLDLSSLAISTSVIVPTPYTTEEMLHKSRRKKLKAAASLYKKQQLAEAKVERQRLKEVKKQERNAAAAQRNVAKTQKQQECNAVNTQKALQLSQRGKRPALQKAASKSKRARGAEQVQEGAEAAPALPAPSKQSQTRTIKRPNRCSE
jgi:hypothetical protein